MINAQERAKNRRKKRKMLIQAFRIAGADTVLKGYLACFLLVAILIRFVEPSVPSVLDGLWYCFSVATTVGFGDITAVTIPGRIITVILSIYSVGVVAIFTAVITGFFLDLAKRKASESVKEFLYDLEHLPELSKEELQDLSDRLKTFMNEQD